MKTKHIIISALLVFTVIAGTYVLTVHAQWGADEAVKRTEERQQDKAVEGVKRKSGGAEIKEPLEETKGEKKLEEALNIPTGYVFRNFVIREMNLGGKWDEAELSPQQDFELGWKYMDAEKYDRALKQGTSDLQLKKTAFGPYYEKMVKLCKEGVKSVGVIHMRSPEENPGWRTGQKLDPPHTLYRELQFQCLAKGEPE